MARARRFWPSWFAANTAVSSHLAANDPIMMAGGPA
jgi:hypothetical protein